MYSCSAKLTVRTVLKLFKLCFVEILFHACHRYPLFQKEKNIMLRCPPPLHGGGRNKFALQQHSLKIYQEIKVES